MSVTRQTSLSGWLQAALPIHALPAQTRTKDMDTECVCAWVQEQTRQSGVAGFQTLARGGLTYL